MIKVETKKSLFLANINTMEEVVAQIEKRIKDAKKVVSKVVSRMEILINLSEQ